MARYASMKATPEDVAKPPGTAEHGRPHRASMKATPEDVAKWEALCPSHDDGSNRLNEGHARRRGEGGRIPAVPGPCRVASMKATPEDVAKHGWRDPQGTPGRASMKATPEDVAKDLIAAQAASGDARLNEGHARRRGEGCDRRQGHGAHRYRLNEGHARRRGEASRSSA